MDGMVWFVRLLFLFLFLFSTPSPFLVFLHGRHLGDILI